MLFGISELNDTPNWIFAKKACVIKYVKWSWQNCYPAPSKDWGAQSNSTIPRRISLCWTI